MLLPHTLKLICNIFETEYIKQEKVKNYNDYLDNFKDYLKDKYKAKNIKQIEESLKEREKQFKKYENIKNIEKINMDSFIVGLDYINFENYISKLNEKQRIAVLNKCLEKVEEEIQPDKETDITKGHFFYYFFIRMMLFSFRYECFEGILKGKEKLKSFFKENKNYKKITETTNDYINDIMLDFFKIKLDIFLGLDREKDKAYLFEKFANDSSNFTYSNEILKITIFFQVLDKEEIQFFLKNYFNHYEKCFSMEVLSKAIEEIEIFDKKKYIKDSFMDNGIQYEDRTINMSNLYKLVFLKDKYQKEDMDFINHSIVENNMNSQYIYKCGFLTYNEKMEILKKLPETELTDVYKKLEGFCNIKKEIEKKATISKIKMGF